MSDLRDAKHENIPSGDDRNSEDNANRQNDPWERKALLIFGSLFLVALLALIGLVPHPSRQEWYVFLCVLGLAAGAVAALLPGSVEWNVNAGLKITGALAVSALVVWFGKDYSPTENDAVDLSKLSTSMSFERCTSAPDSIQNTDVYVVVDGKVVWADLRNPGAPTVTPIPGSILKCESPQRGYGGITIECSPFRPGANLRLFVHGFLKPDRKSPERQERWWSTYDLKVPAIYANMDDTSKDDFTNVSQHP